MGGMIRVLGEARLKNGERMAIKLVEPPQEDYAEKLVHFLEHKPPSDYRAIRERLAGEYVEHCIDRYFVGEIGGEIVGQVWYGLPRNGTGIGNFGHVYTEPAHRGKGIATVLVAATVDDFNHQSDGICLLCSAGSNAAGIYRKYGFEFVTPGSDAGPMALVNKRVAADFAELDEKYFAPGFPVTVRRGHIGDRHDCDRMLDFSKGMNELRKRWHRVFIARAVPTFIDALYCVDDGKGIATVIENSHGRILGYAFVLSPGSSCEAPFKVMDFDIHPQYLSSAVFFVERTCEIARDAGSLHVRAFIAACDEEKLAVFLQAGFEEEYRFEDVFTFDGRFCDIVVLRKRLGHC